MVVGGPFGASVRTVSRPVEGNTNVTVVQASSVTTLQSSANPATLGDALIWLIDVSAVAPA